LDTYTIVIIAVAFLVAGTIKGAMGAGLPTTSIAIMGAALGLREAVPLLVVPAIASNLWLVVQGGRAGHLFRRFGTLINLFAFHVHLPGRFERRFSPIVGLVSGLLTGATGSMLLPVLLYLQALGLDKDDFVRTLGQLLLVASLMWTLALVAEGALDGQAAMLSAFALLPTGVGMLAGQWVRGRVSQERFRTGVFVFLLILGLNLLRQPIF
jgi:uncharacterized membrane protein YfcA